MQLSFQLFTLEVEVEHTNSVLAFWQLFFRFVYDL